MHIVASRQKWQISPGCPYQITTKLGPESHHLPFLEYPAFPWGPHPAGLGGHWSEPGSGPTESTQAQERGKVRGCHDTTVCRVYTTCTAMNKQ